MLKAEHDRLMVEQERLKAESERLLAERAGVLAEFRASGQSLVMTDDQYERMLGLAMAAGPEAMEWFRETARLAGRA